MTRLRSSALSRASMSASALALSLALSLPSGAAHAQTAPTQTAPTQTAPAKDNTVVVVTGFRKAYADAIRTKRDSIEIVDSINSDGLGRFPDLNVGEAIQRIISPTVRALAEAGTPYVGVLYAGLMLTEEGPKLVEYNCRFGDPECQVLMMRLESDLGEYLYACATQSLGALPPPKFSDDTALTVVMAAKGYPGTPEKGGAIGGIAEAEATGAKVFHASTAWKDGKLVANGGRVLNVTARGQDIAEARQKAYGAVEAIDFPSGFCRGDIGWRELARAER